MPASKKKFTQAAPGKRSPVEQLTDAWLAQKAPFCCGEYVPLSNSEDLVNRSEKLTCDDEEDVAEPVALRYDLPGGKTVRKLTLLSDNDESGIEGLLKHYTPATSGQGGEEVLDESYRKAVKLDSELFSTNFNPCDVGIIDAIAQSLLPGIAKTFAYGKSVFEDHLGVVAELYKLNVSL